MRRLLLGVGLLVAVAVNRVEAQQAVQVIVAADGSVRIFDPKTGKELPSVVTRPATGGVRVVEGLYEQAAALFSAGKDPVAKDKKQPLTLEIELGPGGAAKKIIVVQKKILEAKQSDRASPEAKLDRLLQEMAELRKDVNQIKARLEHGSPPPRWKADTDAATLAKQLYDLMRKLQAEPVPPAPRKTSPSDTRELERRIDRLLEEAEELRRNLRKAKAK